MGQKNTQLVTGINRGEFSELAFAINLLAKHLDWTVEKVHESMKVTSKTVTLDAPISFFGDGKMVLAFKEFGYLLAGVGTNVAKKVNADAAKAVQTCTFKPFDEIKCCGSFGKDDVTLLKNKVRVEGISLKCGHSLPERLQTSKWKSIVKSYGSFGVNLEPLAKEYEKRYTSFMQPALRYSSKQGDYTPELVTRGNELLDAFEILLSYICTEIANKKANVEMLAERIIDAFLGDNDNIHFLELDSGIHEFISRDLTERLVKKLHSAKLSFITRSSDSGRSRQFHVKADGESLITFKLTSSTNRAKGSNSELRVVKPQNFIGVYL